MGIRIVRLGSPRMQEEGLRIGTVRRPPRGVKKSEFATRDFYDVWLPELAPCASLLKDWKAIADDRDWTQFVRRYRVQMQSPPACRILDLLAAMSHHSAFSVGCYCIDESRCHRSILRELLQERGAQLERSLPQP